MLVSHVSDVWLLRISCDNLTASHLQDPLCFEVQNYCFNSGKLLFAFRALTLLVGRQEVHLACKNCVIGCWCGYIWSKVQILCIWSS